MNDTGHMECGDFSPLSQGDLSPSSSRDATGDKCVLPLARALPFPRQNHASDLRRRQVALRKRRELAALHNLLAVAFTAGNARFVVGRLDSALRFFDARTGQPGKVAAIL
jgi:hypothetical protein